MIQQIDNAMDLEAILDSSSSSSSSSSSLFSDGKLGNHRGSSSLLSSSNPSTSIGSYNDSYNNFRRGIISGGVEGLGSEDAVDLEQILREDDDDDDDEDGISSNSGGGYMYDRRQRRIEEDFPRPKSLSNSRRMSSLTVSHNSNNNPEEWDILQAILGEDEDDEDDIDYGDCDGSEYRSEETSSPRAQVYSYEYNESGDGDGDDDYVSSSRQRRQLKNNDVEMIRNNKQVDIILQQSDDDDDLYENVDGIDDDDDKFSSSITKYNDKGSYSHRNDYSDNANELRRKYHDNDDDLVDVVNADSFITAMQSEDSELSNKHNHAINNFIIDTTTSNEYSNSTYYISTLGSTATTNEFRSLLSAIRTNFFIVDLNDLA